MRRVGLALQRLFLMLLGYVAAALAGSAAMHVALFATGGFERQALPAMVAASFLFSVPFVALFVAYFALIPSLAALALAEVFGLRRAPAYAVLGGLVGAAVCTMIWRVGGATVTIEGAPAVDDSPLGWGLTLTFVASGVAAGLAYWLVAGRLTGGGAKPSLLPPAGARG